MTGSILHVFRNSPLGGETFRQALYFGKQVGLEVCVYFPSCRSFVLCSGDEAMHVYLDESYLYDPASARERADRIAREMDAEWTEQPAHGKTASTLPDLRGHWTIFSLPRSMSAPQPHPWIPSAVLGPKVRAVVRLADIPVLLPAACFLPWDRVEVLYGGSAQADKAAAWGGQLAAAAGVPVRVVASGRSGLAQQDLEEKLAGLDLPEGLELERAYHPKMTFQEIVQDLPRTALVVFGAYGHSAFHKRRFGSKAELALRSLPQNLLMIGPHCPGPHISIEPDGSLHLA